LFKMPLPRTQRRSCHGRDSKSRPCSYGGDDGIMLHMKRKLTILLHRFIPLPVHIIFTAIRCARVLSFDPRLTTEQEVDITRVSHSS
jgi:hypothetical protein